MFTFDIVFRNWLDETRQVQKQRLKAGELSRLSLLRVWHKNGKALEKRCNGKRCSNAATGKKEIDVTKMAETK